MHILTAAKASAWGGLALFSGTIAYFGIDTLIDGWMSVSENISAYPFHRWHYLAESLRSVCPSSECTDVSPRTLAILASLHVLTWAGIMVWGVRKFIRTLKIR
jgi:hypothetical protein